MAKRELSSTLKNLKNVISEVSTIPHEHLSVVIMEGDPYPRTIKGRMSFQNFNPFINKLNDEAASGHEGEALTSSDFQSGRNFDRGSGNLLSEQTDMDMGKAQGELKRKRSQEVSQTSHPKRQQKRNSGNKRSSSSENPSSQKQLKHDKLDFNVLGRPKSQRKSHGD